MIYTKDEILHFDFKCGYCGEHAYPLSRENGGIAIYCPHCDKFLTGFYRNYDSLMYYWEKHRYRKCAWCGKELDYWDQDFPLCEECEKGKRYD